MKKEKIKKEKQKVEQTNTEEKTINENIRKDRNEIIDLQDRWENIFGKNRRSDILYERHIDKD